MWGLRLRYLLPSGHRWATQHFLKLLISVRQSKMCTPADQKSDEVEMLIKKSHEAKGCAYSPYTKCSTGAALLTENGKTYTGCSIENSSLGLSACAECVAIYKAVSEGCTKFKSLAVCSDRRDYTPCGACRQVLREFGDKTEVHMIMQDGNRKTMTIADLLPMSLGK